MNNLKRVYWLGKKALNIFAFLCAALGYFWLYEIISSQKFSFTILLFPILFAVCGTFILLFKQRCEADLKNRKFKFSEWLLFISWAKYELPFDEVDFVKIEGGARGYKKSWIHNIFASSDIFSWFFDFILGEVFEVNLVSLGKRFTIKKFRTYKAANKFANELHNIIYTKQ